MPAYPQFWSNDKLSQIITESSETVAAGATGATTTQYLFNDKGSLLGATSMTGYYLVVEASHDGGQTWLRSGLQVLDERWVELSITGTTDNTGGAPAAQTTAFTPIGTGLGQAITAIPQGSGRQISYRLNVPLGASAAGVRWRLIETLVASTLTAASVSNVPAGTVSAVTVQAAIDELGSEKAALSGPTFTADTLRTGVETGFATNRYPATAGGQFGSSAVPYYHKRGSVPTISLSGGASANMAGGYPAAANITAQGFNMDLQSAVAGDTYVISKTYTTSA